MEMNNKTYILFTKAEGQKQIFQLDDANRPLDIQISPSQEISFSLAKAAGFDVQKKVIQLDHDNVSLDVVTTFFGQEISIYLVKTGAKKRVFQLDDGDGHLNIHIPAFRQEISIMHTRADGHSVVKQLIWYGGADGPWNVQISTTHQEEPMEWAYDKQQ